MELSDQGIGRFRRYSSDKDSGVEWLGAIPAQWRVNRLRSTVKGCQNGVWGDEPDGVYDIICVRVADFDRMQFRVMIDDPTLRSVEPRFAQVRLLEPGDLLLEKSGGGEKQPVGAVVIYDHHEPAVCSNFIARAPVADGFDSRFLTYLHAALYAARINTRSIKQSTGIQNLDSSSYLGEAVGLPELAEQRAIAAFLDRETAKIDGLVTRKERLIELLQEKRTALITCAVTRGLDPNVPMKDCGVERLGEIPAHWDTPRMWRISRAVSGGTPAKEEAAYWDGEIPWVSPKDMKRRFIDSSEDRITELAIEETGVRLLAPPVVLIVVRGMILAHSFPVAITTTPVTINQDMKALIFKDGIDPLFMVWVFEGIGRSMLAALVEEAAHGTRAIRMDEWRSVMVPVPPVPEQRAIASFLDCETETIDALVAKVREAIARLEEFRTALISAAVTGKIDVREEAA